MRLLRQLYMLTGLLTLCVSIGCSGGGNAPAGDQPVTLALNWLPEPQFGGFYAADLAGAFDREGFEVTIRGGGPGAPTVQEAALGRVEFAIAAGDQILTARQEGLDVVALFAVFQTSPRAIMVRGDTGITALGDVFQRRMTLAMEPGLDFVEFLRRRYGFENTSVVPYAGAMERLASEPDFGMQCFYTSEPIVARRRGIRPLVFPVADAGFNPYTTVLITRGELVREKPEMVQRFVRAVRDGWRAYLDDPAGTNAAMRSLNPGMDEASFTEAANLQAALIENDFTREAGLGRMTRERWETLGRQLKELGVLRETPDIDKAYADIGGQIK